MRLRRMEEWGEGADVVRGGGWGGGWVTWGGWGRGNGEGDAEMRCEPDSANSGWCPSGCALHSCRVHACTIIFGPWPLLPLHYNIHTLLLSVDFTVTRAHFLIKLKHAEAAVISTQPQHSVDHTPSIAQHLLIQLPSNYFHFILVINLYHFTSSIGGPSLYFYTTCLHAI